VAAERAALLRASLESLPENWQYALRQKYQAELSVREIADLMESTPKAIESILSRARQRLRDLMHESTSEEP
jgi:RNA polymerase sigma-70 factor (ECF subfamily)